MTTKNIIKTLVALAIAFSVQGCSTIAITGSADVEKTAFNPHKKYAVVSIASVKTMQGEKGMVNMFKSMDEIPGTNTQPIIDKLKPAIYGALGKNQLFTLVPEKSVLASKAYKGLAEDPHQMQVMFMNLDMNEAGGYKYISDEQKYAKLAKDLGVDGVIALTFSFNVTQSKGFVSIMGISMGKKSYSATVSSSVVAYDQNGKTVWKDSTMKEAEPGDAKAIIVFDTSDFGGTNFEKFHPSALDMATKGVQTLYARLDDTLAGRDVSSFQSVK